MIGGSRYRRGGRDAKSAGDHRRAVWALGNSSVSGRGTCLLICTFQYGVVETVAGYRLLAEFLVDARAFECDG